MHLADLISDGDILVALEPEELGLLILQVLAKWHPQAKQIELGPFANGALAGYASYPRRDQITLAIREAWVWLEGQGLLYLDPAYLRPERGYVHRRPASEYIFCSMLPRPSPQQPIRSWQEH
jgi:hypothetical protein